MCLTCVYLIFFANLDPNEVYKHTTTVNRFSVNHLASSNKSLSFQWLDISESEKTKYFTQDELAAIDKQNPICQKHQFLHQQCCPGGTSHGGSTRWAPHQCLNKHLLRRFDFSQSVKSDNNRRTPNAYSYTLSDVADLLPNNSVIVSIGDSIQHQITASMNCDLFRNGYEPINKSYKPTNTELSHFFRINFTNFSITHDWHSTIAVSTNITFCKSRSSVSASTISKVHCVKLIAMLHYILDTHLLSNVCDWGDVIIMNWSLHYHLQKHREYAAYNSTIKTLFNAVKNCTRHNAYQLINKSTVFVWRERTSQHFFTPGGMYFSKFPFSENVWNSWYKQVTQESATNISDCSSTCCHALKLYSSDEKNSTIDLCNLKTFVNYSSNVLSRNKLWTVGCFPLNITHSILLDKLQSRTLIQEIANDLDVKLEFMFHNYGTNNEFMQQIKNINMRPLFNSIANSSELAKLSTNVYYIPMIEVTEGLWDQHPGECTHYCTTPYLFQYVYHGLYLALRASAHVTLSSSVYSQESMF